jgi:hypothetical protein
MLKYLRIAVTALSLTACVLLIALWVRSYRWTDILTWRSSDFDIGADSVAGGTAVFVYVDADRTIDAGIIFQSYDQDDWPDMPPPDRTWRFQFETTPNELYVVLPHWFHLAIISALSSALWVPWRFRLRTLLIAITLVAVVMGIVVVLS